MKEAVTTQASKEGREPEEKLEEREGSPHCDTANEYDKTQTSMKRCEPEEKSEEEVLPGVMLSMK